MIGILIAVVAVFGVVAAADLLLSFAIIRRLAAVESGSAPGVGGGTGSPAIGHRVGEFRVDLLTGGTFTRADLTGTRATVMFVMPGCEPCEAAVAELAAMPAPLPIPLYILITGGKAGGDAAAAAADMPAGAHVGLISAPDATSAAFGVDGFPTALDLDDAIVRASGLRVSSLFDHASR